MTRPKKTNYFIATASFVFLLNLGLNAQNLNKTMTNNDLKKEGLNGAIRSIESLVYNDQNELKSEVLKQYNELGNLILINAANLYTDEIEEYSEFSPVEDDTRVQIIGRGDVKSQLNYFNTGYGDINFTYNEKGLLTKVSANNNPGKFRWVLSYDDNGNLITKDVLTTIVNYQEKDNLLYRVKYVWENGSLKSKYTYEGNGDLYEFMDYAYSPNKQIISFRNANQGQNQIIVKDFNENKLLVNKVINDKHTNNVIGQVNFSNSSISKHSDFNYSYLNNKLDRIKNREFFKSNGNWKSNSAQPTQLRYIRDSHGNITSVVSSVPYCPICEYEWEYKYDSNGNWIERSKNSVIRKDIVIKKLEQVVKRTIIYN